MKKLMFPCTKMLYRCRWEGVIVDCKELFTVSETYQGFCCSFNIQKPVSSTATNKAKKIRKTQYFGYQMGLSVILNPLIEKNAMTSVNSEGMKILVNQFNLYPSARTIERMLPHKQETYVEVRPERTDCSSTVRALPISDRGCVFSNEHALKWVWIAIVTLLCISCLFQVLSNLYGGKLSHRMHHGRLHQNLRVSALFFLQHRQRWNLQLQKHRMHCRKLEFVPNMRNYFFTK